MRKKLPHSYTVIDLFSGAGGLALGLEKAGLSSVMFNDINPNACATLRKNRPCWNVVESDIKQIDFSCYKGKFDILTGGFPCQSFSYAGKKRGFNDKRGSLFYDFVRAIEQAQPLICVAENVKGLLRHDEGKTIARMCARLDIAGYDVLQPALLNALDYRVPQKRERLFIVAIKKGIQLNYQFPKPFNKRYVLKDALKAGELFDCDVPLSTGIHYSTAKADILSQIEPGGCWRDLPPDLQKMYLKQSFYLPGGKTGMARRISWDEPCLTLTCHPAQKQTERCHPDVTRPFTVREYARIQTFPDEWEFSGSLTSQYQQIGNAVPANLAYAMGCSLVSALDQYYSSGKNDYTKTA